MECSEELKTARNSSIRLASHKGAIVAVKMLKKRNVEITRSLRKELHIMKEMSHDNINRFVGACVDPPNVCIVQQFCSRGSLKVGEICFASDCSIFASGYIPNFICDSCSLLDKFSPSTYTFQCLLVFDQTLPYITVKEQ